MHILLIHQYYLEKGDSGGSRFNEMTKAWEAEGHKTTVLAGMVHHLSGKKLPRYKGKYTYEDQYSPLIKVIRCHVSESYSAGFTGRFWGYISFVMSSIYAGIFVAKEKYDVIVVTSPPLFVGFTAWVLSVIKRRPFVFEIRDLWPESAIDTGVLNNKFIIWAAYKFEKFIYNRATRINVLTTAFRDKLIQDKGISPEKIMYIPNAADFEHSDHALATLDVAAFRKKLGWEDKVVITYVGAHGVANHLIQVLDTAERIKDRKEVLFVLIGEGMERNKLIEEARKRNLTNVQFLEAAPKPDIFYYIMASDFGASVLKKVDTFKTVLSNKTFDYMSCKIPIMMLIDGVSRALVEEAECGVYVEPENPADYEAKIRHYLTLGKEEWHRQGEAGFQYAKSHFDRQVLARKYLQLLSEL